MFGLLRTIAVSFIATAMCRAQTSPAIQVESVTPCGSWPGNCDVVTGRVVGVNLSQFRIAPLVFVSGLGFFSKPSCAETPIAIDGLGRFHATVASGGLDHRATLIALLAVPVSLPVRCSAGLVWPGPNCF
jgi:hypothetical protein